MSRLGQFFRVTRRTHPWFFVSTDRSGFLFDVKGYWYDDSHASRTLENIAANDVSFTEEDFKEIDQVLVDNPVKGGRYYSLMAHTLMRWTKL